MINTKSNLKEILQAIIKNFPMRHIGWFPKTKILSYQSSLLCIVVELLRGGSVAVAVTVTVAVAVAVALTIAAAVPVAGALDVAFIVPSPLVMILWWRESQVPINHADYLPEAKLQS